MPAKDEAEAAARRALVYGSKQPAPEPETEPQEDSEASEDGPIRTRDEAQKAESEGKGRFDGLFGGPRGTPSS